MSISPTTTVRGVDVPTVGIGTFQVSGEDTAETVRDAIEAGYRHVDTAAGYGNEREVGEGVRASGVARDEVWVTTKVSPSDLAPDDLRASARRSLDLLGLDRVDLLLMHWPPQDASLLEPALREMQALRREGLAREIGVSNFPARMLRDALEIAPEIFCDQVEYHARLAQQDLLDVAAEHDLLIAAYAPIGSGNGVIEDETVQKVAAEHGVTGAQVALAWLARQDRVAVLPRSTDPGRRRENLAALDVELTEADVAALDELSAGRVRYFDPPFAPDWNA